MRPRVAKARAGAARRVVPRAAKPEDIEAQLATARATLSRDAAFKRSAIKAGPVREAVLSALAEEGYELTKTWVRVPPSRQIAAAFEHGAVVVERSLKDHVAGATPAEIKASLEELLRRGEVRRVLRGKVTALVGSDAHVLAPEKVAALRRHLQELVKLLTSAEKKKAALLNGDVDEAFSPLEAALGRNGERERVPAHDDAAMRAVLESVEATREATGLSFIPKVMARLSSVLSVEATRAALLAAAERDLVELRPEGGLGRLSPAELERCLPGPEGTYLSWARLRKESGDESSLL